MRREELPRMRGIQPRASTEAGNIMNATTSSVLPLTAIALCLTPARIYELLGFEWSIACLEAARRAKCRREVRAINEELESAPVRHDNYGAPVYSWQEPTQPAAGAS